MLAGDLVQVKVDQVILSRAPARAISEALAAGMRKAAVETAVAYDGTCVTDASALASLGEAEPHVVPGDAPAYNILVARPGIGFPGPVHLERFAAPARLALTDDPRLATTGGIGMLTLVVAPSQLGQALATGSIWLRPPRSVQVHLSGRVRPFVCARDVALELLRKGLADVVRRIDRENQAPVVLEFVGPSARLLSVGERSVLCALAPYVGAAGALFISDEKTEGFLRDQRRSKAHRALVPDPGAPCDEVLSLDLGAVDPLLMDDQGQVRPVRDLAGKAVTQVILGGDSGVTLRDMLAAAMLLKSKRVPSRLDLVVAPPSRQVLEVLAQSGALVDLVATGARIIEPDRRVLTGEVYPPPSGGLSLRTFDPEPRVSAHPPFVVASAETLAYAVATGTVGDPRSFKRPVRVTVPRALPTDDVLVLRDKKGDSSTSRVAAALPAVRGWKGVVSLDVCVGLPASLLERRRRAEAGALARRVAAREAEAKAAAERVAPPPRPSQKGDARPELRVLPPPEVELALVLSTDEEARALAERQADLEGVRAVIAPRWPSGAASALAAEGVLVLGADEATLAALRKQKTLELEAPGAGGRSVRVEGAGKLELAWNGKGVEAAWLAQGNGVRGPGPIAPPPRASAPRRKSLG